MYADAIATADGADKSDHRLAQLLRSAHGRAALTNQVTRAPPISALNLPASLCQRGVRPRLARCRRAPLHIHLPRPAVAPSLFAARFAHLPYAHSLLPAPVSHTLKIRVCVVELILAPFFPPLASALQSNNVALDPGTLMRLKSTTHAGGVGGRCGRS